MDKHGQESQLDDTGHHPLYRDLESRRAYPRVKLRMPVQVGLPGGKVAVAHMYNLSPDGIQLRCNRATAARIQPRGGSFPAGTGPELLVVVRLRSGKDTGSHVLRCRLSYLLPQCTGTDEIIMGLTFHELLPAQRAAINAALSASLEPMP